MPEYYLLLFFKTIFVILLHMLNRTCSTKLIRLFLVAVKKFLDCFLREEKRENRYILEIVLEIRILT